MYFNAKCSSNCLRILKVTPVYHKSCEKMGRNILFLFVLCLFIFETTAVIMCTNQSASSTDVSLNLVNEADVSDCNCSVKLSKKNNIGSIRSRITINTVQFSGCKYKLVISHDNTNGIISCSNNNTVHYDINISDEIKLYLESTTSQDENTTFEVKLTSGVTGDLIRLDCLLPTESTQETTIAPPTSKPNTEGVTKPGGDDINIGIIGGAVGGGLLLIIIIIIIIIIVCVVKKRRKKNREKRDYNRPTVTESQHDYTDIDLGAKGNNSSRQSDNTDQKANSPVEMEIIENDLYVSSDDIMDPKSCDNNNSNQKTDANNGPVEMEIIDNDLYVSSSEALNSTSHDNDGPLYAVVNKKPKSRKSDHTDKSNDIAGYTDSDLGTKGNNSSSRQSDNTEQNTKSPVEIEMDPKSRDDNNTNQKTDAMDSKSRDDNNTDQKTDAMDSKSRDDYNTNQKTDANNDRYVSSSEALNSHDNDGPLYSSVNKKPKSPISNHADNSNGITGEDHHDTLL